ncbi:transglutaminase family protein [Nocardioides campestrisoli]|uniref:transglutaminase family protein n=1 Tax=Nocardioides campestrisoli TaxID=2736757 RepID=UPI00163D868E|nr:DUF3488 and transglutaminase-like domain-containing protein [Nocardioides campestrisoli]
MTRPRSPWGRGLLVSLVAALMVWLTMTTWQPLTRESSDFLGPLFLLGVATALTGSLLRRAGTPTWLVYAVQVVVAGGCVLGTTTGSVLPTSEAWQGMSTALRDAVTSANQYQAPVPADAPSLAPLFILVGAVGLVLVDLVAVSLRLAAASGLVVLALYALPIAFVESSTAWWSFAVLALTFLLLLFLQQEEEVGRWGHGTGDRPDPDPAGTRLGVRRGHVRRAALTVGAGTVALAVLLPSLVPTFDLAVWDGPGAGSGGDGISIDNPLVDMRRDLSRGDDVPLLQVASDGPRPSYVRLSVLTRFNGEEWTSGNREVPSDQLAAGWMPPLVGVGSGVPRTETRYRFEAYDTFESQWLPTTSQISRIDAPGDWRYDRSTMDFIAGDDEVTTAGLSWSLHAVDLQYDLDSLDDASSGASQVGSAMVQLPADLPESVESLAESVAGDEPSRFRQARALQEWFRTEFTYNLDQVDTVGNDELAAFLDEDGREGYCEQFAAAMAVMARVHDIPSRVAVGFLEPTEVGPGVWEFSSHDLHAWPELYFPGSGWVRFEPTPSGRADQAPSYTVDALPAVEETARPTLPRAEERAPARDRGREAGQEEAAPEQQTESSVPWGTVLTWVLLLMLAGVVVLGPRSVRSRRRDARLEDGDIESLWAELRDHSVDHGRTWPTGRSPRETAEQVADWFGTSSPEEHVGSAPSLNPYASSALERLVQVLERSRYGRPESAPAPETSWQRDLAKCTEAITAGVGPHRARVARWWPASLVRRPADRPVGLTAAGRPGSTDRVD